MKRHKFSRLRLFLKACAVAFIAYFLLYFMLDAALCLALSRLEKECSEDMALLGKGRVEGPAANGTLGDLERTIREAGFNLSNYGVAGNNAEMDDMFRLNHRLLEDELEVPDDTHGMGESLLVLPLRLHREAAGAVRDAVLSGEAIIWGDPDTSRTDLLKVVQIGEWLAAESLLSASEGNGEEAEKFAQALQKVSLSLLGERSQNYWLISVSLAQTHSGLLRKTGVSRGEASAPDIAPYARALRETILGQAERMIIAAGSMQKLHYSSMHRREGMVWRTYGRLWCRYSLIREIKKRLKEFRDSESFLECGRLREEVVPSMDGSIWMTTGAEFRTEDMRFRLQKLALSFELTRWALSRREKRDSAPRGVLKCSEIKLIDRQEGDIMVIGFETPFKTKTREGVIDIPCLFRYPRRGE